MSHRFGDLVGPVLCGVGAACMLAALACYASQQHRRYADPEYVWNLARTHGININREYAEVFQVYRAIG